MKSKPHEAKDIIPQLKGAMRQEGERPIIEYHEGRESIVNALKTREFDASVEEYFYTIYPRDRVEELFTEKERQVARNIRISKNIKGKSIYSYNKGEYTPDTTADRIRVESSEYPIKADISIYGDTVHIHTLGKKTWIYLYKKCGCSRNSQIIV